MLVPTGLGVGLVEEALEVFVWGLIPNSLSVAAASASEAFSLPDRRGGEEPFLEA
jgi:hypothetical protein